MNNKNRWKKRAGIKSGENPWFSDIGYQKPLPAQNDEQLISQLNLAKSFIGAAVKAITTKDHGQAYILSDRSLELLEQIRTAMEDLEPT